MTNCNLGWFIKHLPLLNPYFYDRFFRLLNYCCLALFVPFYAKTQFSVDSGLNWMQLASGVSMLEICAPHKSVTGDSIIFMLRLDPHFLQSELLCASEHGNISRTVKEWADTFGFDIVVNAGMYDLSNGLINKGYMRNRYHVNNPTLQSSYNCMIALNPIDTSDMDFKIVDLTCNEWTSLEWRYASFSQGMRMLDCRGNPLSWNKKNQLCSMLIAATDSSGLIYFIFSRAPYSHNDMIAFLRSLRLGLCNAVYLEGGPETSLYLKVGDTLIEKIGSYVSETYPTDENDYFWKLPNVIGFKLK